MVAFAARRAVETIPVLFITSLIIFLMIHLIPGDPAVVIVGPDAEPAVVEAVRKDLGLNEPLPIQYGIWLGHILRGDFGNTYSTHYPVGALLLQRLPATIELAGAALMLALLISVPLGVVAALRQRTRFDIVTSVVTTIGLAIPEFWSSILLVIVFAVWLGWLPPGGRVPLLENPLAAIPRLVLPAFALAVPVAAAQTRFVRAAVIETLNQPYIRTANAKGLRPRDVVYFHALRAALIPVATVVGIQLGRLLGGAVFIESIFNWPGIGRLLVVSLQAREYATVQGTLLVLVAAFALVNLAMDIVYGLLDPRIRLGRL